MARSVFQRAGSFIERLLPTNYSPAPSSRLYPSPAPAPPVLQSPSSRRLASQQSIDYGEAPYTSGLYTSQNQTLLPIDPKTGRPYIYSTKKIAPPAIPARTSPQVTPTASLQVPSPGPSGTQGPFFVPSGPPDESLSLIEQDYQNTLSQIAAEESRLSGSQPGVISGVETEAARGRAAFQQEREGRLQRIGEREQQQERATGGALEQLRNLFREVERNQVAQLSAGGLTRSSAAEAMASLLGREMAQRVAGETGTRDEVIRNLAEERRRTEDYFGTQLSSLEQETAHKIRETNLRFRTALDQLGAVRGQASVAKQQARADLFNQFQQQVFQIQQANFQAQRQLTEFGRSVQTRLQAAQQTAFNLPDVATQAQQVSSQFNLPISGVGFTPGSKRPINIQFAKPRRKNIWESLGMTPEEIEQISSGGG